MPRIKKTTVFLYDELDEKAQERARDHYRQHNLYYAWGRHVYEDAERIGLRITSFELDGAHHITGDLYEGFEACLQAIIAEHGPNTATHRLAVEYQDKITQTKLADDKAIAEGADADEVSDAQMDWLAEQEQDFLYDLLEKYHLMLRQERDWLDSDEHAEESIRANEYEFTRDGRLA